MKKCFWAMLCCAIVGMTNVGVAQDTIKTQSGEVIKAKVLTISRKETVYKTYSDPEFTSYTLPYKELASIKKEGEEKPVLFNHGLPRGYLSLSMAPPYSAFALGSFGKRDFDNPKSEPGFAKKGFNAKLEGAFYFWKRLGASFKLGYTGFSYDYSAFSTAYNGGSTGNFYANPYPGSGENQQSNEGDWRLTHFGLGPIYSLKFGKRLTVDLKAQVGYMSIVKPELYLTFNNFTIISGNPIGDSTVYRYDRSQKTGFSYTLGTSIRFALSKRIAIYGAADYVASSALMNIDMNTTGLNVVETNSSSRVRYNISTLNLSLGLAYQFKRKGNKYE